MIDCISVGETEFPFSLLANYYLQIEIEANKNRIEAGVDILDILLSINHYIHDMHAQTDVLSCRY